MRSTWRRRSPGEMCRRPGGWAPRAARVQAHAGRLQCLAIAALAGAPKISSGSASGVTRLSSASTPRASHSAAVVSASSYSGSSQLAPAGLTNATLRTRPS